MDDHMPQSLITQTPDFRHPQDRRQPARFASPAAQNLVPWTVTEFLNPTRSEPASCFTVLAVRTERHR